MLSWRKEVTALYNKSYNDKSRIRQSKTTENEQMVEWNNARDKTRQKWM